MRDVLVLTTGGTIEKVHDWKSEGLGFEMGGKAQIADLLHHSRCFHAGLRELMMKDSLDFTDDDRMVILTAVQEASEESIVVSHGTGTMAETARFLADQVGDKTVVLTGAMRPYSFGRSDASFNMGGAIIAAQILPAGVYGVMNGRAFSAGELSKNTEAGRFDLGGGL
ncbi:MAG: asparaginase domain-containing protein [Cohaesibacteraceae bacterium]